MYKKRYDNFVDETFRYEFKFYWTLIKISNIEQIKPPSCGNPVMLNGEYYLALMSIIYNNNKLLKNGPN